MTKLAGRLRFGPTRTILLLMAALAAPLTPAQEGVGPADPPAGTVPSTEPAPGAAPSSAAPSNALSSDPTPTEAAPAQGTQPGSGPGVESTPRPAPGDTPGTTPALPREAIVIEGEDAASTNFAGDAVLLYGAGENRTLQLQQRETVSGGDYYADYVFLAPAEGTYRFYYGGSPPGAENQLLPSYGSPFELTVNDGEPKEVYLEDVSTGPFYSAPYMWVDAGTIDLEEGVNRVRISVTQRRRHDAQFFLYLDRLILMPEEREAGRPDLLPPAGDFSPEFQAIEDHLITIRETPQALGGYIGVANLYTLVGDNINALRYLNRARLMEANNPRVLQLIARNTIWRGDINAGLERFWELISAAPDDRNAYLEAGKIAAWSGFYGASEQYYLAGLNNFPNDLDMLANLGFTYLWWNREQRAREIFTQASRLATSPDALIQLGQVYVLNEDLQRAEELYRAGIERFPGDYRPYVQLVNVLYSLDRVEEAQQVIEQAVTQVDNVRLAQEAFDRIGTIRKLRSQTVDRYEQAVVEEPENLDARRRLAQTYFWIGRRQEGIREYESILAVRARLALNDLFADQQELPWSELQARLIAALADHSVDALSDDLQSLTTATRNLERTARRPQETMPDEVDQITELMPRITDHLVLLTDLRDQYDATVTSIVERGNQSAADAAEELTRAEESVGWKPPIQDIERELLQGAGHGVTEAALTYRSLITALNQDVSELPPAVQEAEPSPDRTADAMMHLLRAGRERVNQSLLDQIATVAGGTHLENEAFGELVLFVELYREELEAMWSPASPAGTTPDGGAAGAGEATSGTEDTTPAAEGANPETVPPPDPYDENRVNATIQLGQQFRTEAGRVLRESTQALQTIRTGIGDLQESLAQLTRRQLFTLQNDTSELRNRLGNLYLDVGNVQAAVQQFQLVLGVDPNNLDATYSLANAYKQSGRWRRAQNEYSSIHRIDPQFRNTVQLHNELARQYADTFTAEAILNNESQRVTSNYSFTYLWRINSLLDLQTRLAGDSVRVRTPVSGGIDRQAYWRHELELQPTLNFRGALNGGLTGTIGVQSVNNQLYLRSNPNVLLAEPLDAADYFQSYRIEPVYGASLAIGRGAVFAEGAYRRAPYQPASDLPVQTAAHSYPPIQADRLDAGGTINLSGSRDPFWSRLSFRTGTFANILEQDGTRPGTHYSAAQDIRFYLFNRSEPFERLALTATATYEDYVGTDISAIYLPNEITQVGGVLTYDTYRSLANSMTYGVVLRAYAGLYRPDSLRSGAANGLRGEVNTTFELTRTNVAFQFRLNYTATTTTFEAIDYYSLSGALAVVARNVRILER